MKMTADEYYEAGNENLHREEFTEAITNYDKAIELDPRNANFYCRRGISKSNLKQRKEAIADYDIAIILDPKNVTAYYNRGLTNNELKKFMVSISDFSKAIELGMGSNQHLAYCDRGVAKVFLKNYAGALADFDETIKLKPDYAIAFYNRGCINMELGLNEDAIADYDQAIKHDKTYASAYSNRGVAKNRLGQHQEAIFDYNHAILLDPENAETHHNRGSAYHSLGDSERAKVDFFKLMKMTQEEPPASLYKYIPIDPNQLLSLINGEIYFAHLSQLNDPLECFFLNKSSAMGELLQQLKLEPRICSMLKHSPGAEAAGTTLLFAHYANDHKGICVEHKIDFKKLNKNTNVSYGEVLYEQKDKSNGLKDLYMLKDPAWEYEDEFRFVCFDNKKFAATKVKSVTFGLKCPQAHRDIVRYLLPEEVAYKEMAYKGVGNQIMKQSVTWQSKKISSEEAFKLMLNEDLTHLYFYHQQRAEAANLA